GGRGATYVGHACSAAGLWRNADAAGEGAPAAVGGRAAVLFLGGAGRGRADAAGNWRVHAAGRPGARVGRAPVAVGAVDRRPGGAYAGRAHVRGGAGVAVVARCHVRREHAHVRAVAGAGDAGVRVGARGPRRDELARDRAAGRGRPVGRAIVAL